jgi:tetratricopeptide (TPR) repeat protein
VNGDQDADELQVAIQRLSLWEMLTNPYRTMQGFIEFFLAWLFTRQWLAVLGLLPVILLLVTLGGLLLCGWLVDKNTLVTRYASWVEAELKEDREVTDSAAPAATDALMKVEGVSPFGELLLRRVLQLENSDSRSRYLVALQIGNRGRRGQARQLMRQLAPERNRGFAPAHAWLAIDRLLQGQVRDQAARTVLLNDLEVAATWQGTGTKLREVLAELLESEGRIGDAIKVLQAAAESDSGAWVKLVAVANRNGRKQPAEDAAQKAKALFNRRIVEQTATSLDFVQLASLLVLELNPDEAIRQLKIGLNQFPTERILNLTLSECYRVKFIMSYKETAQGIDCEIEYLDEALKADPTNLAVSEEVAKLMAKGGIASPALAAALDQQLAEDKSTTMTHLLLATRSLKENKLEAAIPYLEVALRKSPNAPVVLNNLALALARVSIDNVERSRELIARALRISGPNAELLDSQGEILMLAGDYVGAIASFESAIELDGKRIAPRKRLIVAYEKAGLKDLVPLQEEKVRKLEAELEASPSRAAPTDPTPPIP